MRPKVEKSGGFGGGGRAGRGGGRSDKGAKEKQTNGASALGSKSECHESGRVVVSSGKDTGGQKKKGRNM
jgi:hypothetical protein